MGHGGLAFFVQKASLIQHPVAGRWIDILETVERMGDYVAPLAVIVLLKGAPRAHPGTTGVPRRAAGTEGASLTAR